MEKTINRNLVRYSAGTAIFCPHCGNVADMRRWIVATVNGRTISTFAPCWDKAIENKPVPSGVEVLDGRILFSRKKG